MIDSYSKLSIGKYLELKDILERDCDEIEKNVELVGLLNDMEVDDVLELPLTTFNRLLNSTGFLCEAPIPNRVATSYVLAGMKLDVMMNMKDCTTAQYIDYQTFIKDSEKYLVELLGVFLIPEGKKYGDGYDIGDVYNVIRNHLSIVDALGLSAFFLGWFQALTKATLESSIKRLKKMMKKEKDMTKKEMYKKAIQHLEASGAGLPW